MLTTLEKHAGAAPPPPSLTLGSPIAGGELRTPVLGPPQPQRSSSPNKPRASPTACSLAAFAQAVERAKYAESRIELYKRQVAGLQDELKARENVCFAQLAFTELHVKNRCM
jgi:hypothetical protein